LKLLTLATAIVIIILWGCNKNPQKQPEKYTDFERGWSFLYYKKQDSAFQMFTRYVENPDDSLKKGMAYRYMGDIQWKMGDLHGAQENGARATHTLDKLDKKHHTQIGYAYNLLGDVSLDLKHYDESINMYDNAINFLKSDDFMLEVMNGKATAFQKKGEYKNAIAVYDSILALKPADQSLVARVIDNKARTRWLQDPAYPVLPEFWLALKIRTDSQYHAGLNASYAHLSDYYEKNNPDSALSYANRMYQKAHEIQKPEDRLEAMDKLIRLNKTADLKQYWYASYKTLNDSFQLSRDTTRARFAMIRYDFQKSKADNLVLQQHISKQRMLMYGLISIAVIFITGLWTWYAKRRKRIKQESENAIRNSRLKISQKVHDVVANGLYGIMNELEHSETVDREPLINKIEGLYERSRNISYEDVTTAYSVDHDSEIHRLLNSFANETQVIIVGNQPSFWNKVTGFQKQELHLILNEVMVNMKKHSQAKNVSVVFKKEDDKAFITYKDDGVGFPVNLEFGNGLNNTVSRIKSLNGEVNFEKSGEAGVSIAISFPLQPDKT